MRKSWTFSRTMMDNVQSWVQIGTWCGSLSTSMLYNQHAVAIHGRIFRRLRPWAHVRPGWACLRAILGLCWPYVSSSLAYVGPVLALCWPYVGPMLAHLGAYVEAMLAICETIPVERPPRCLFFLPGPFCGTKNHVKTTVFYFCQQKKLCSSKRAKRKKKTMFLWLHTHETP